jgi:hypothetical protein
MGQFRPTGFDPPLVAAAYNAGGLRVHDSRAIRWKLVQYPFGTSAHVDNLVIAFSAAMSMDVIAALNASLGNRLPSFGEVCRSSCSTQCTASRNH